MINFKFCPNVMLLTFNSEFDLSWKFIPPFYLSFHLFSHASSYSKCVFFRRADQDNAFRLIVYNLPSKWRYSRHGGIVEILRTHGFLDIQEDTNLTDFVDAERKRIYLDPNHFTLPLGREMVIRIERNRLHIMKNELRVSKTLKHYHISR